jgi:hypothetical protein
VAIYLGWGMGFKQRKIIVLLFFSVYSMVKIFGVVLCGFVALDKKSKGDNFQRK